MTSHYPQFAAGFRQLLDRLADHPIAVVGHARPDGDCIGSQVALARMLTALGMRAVCVNPDPVPRRLRFLIADGLTYLRTDEVLATASDYAAVFVDCADHRRGGERLKEAFPRPIGNIDHHLSTVRFAEINLVDEQSAATCEILTGLFLDAGLTIDPLSAQALYAGILTDTGQFRFGSTSQRCFQLAGELVARGASPSEAGYELYERESTGKFKLLQRFLSSFRFECGGRVCLGILPDGVFAETGASVEDTEGLVDYARCIEGVDVGVLIEERTGGGVKASLRSKDPAYRLDRIAAQFNGGGHACAAGLTIGISLEEFYPKLIEALGRQLGAVDTAAPLE